MLARIRRLEGHSFLSDDVAMVVGEHLVAEKVATYRQVTDAHLLALAVRHKARLATFDRGIKALEKKADSVELVPTR